MSKYFLNAILFTVFTPTLVQAEFYACDFTEPFFQVYIATSSQNVTVSHWDKRSSYGTKITKIKKSGFKRTFELANGKSIEIDRNIVGNDGMSDQFIPFTIQFDGNWGGCDSEDTLRDSVIYERWSSWNAPNGLSFVNYWPGEYGMVMGYKALENVSLKKAYTWQRLNHAQRDEKTCTIRKGKLIVPIEAKGNEIYGHLTPTAKVQEQGQSTHVIAYSGEGYCLMEGAEYKDFDSCPDYNTKVIEIDEESHLLAPFGSYVFMKCQEGHYSWIHEEAFSDSSEFEVVNLGF